MKVVFTILIVLTSSYAYAGQNEGMVMSYNTESVATVCPPEASAKKEDYETIETFFNEYQPYLTNISAYEPIYFLVGTDPAKSKFQISFKYQFLKSDCSAAQKHPWVAGFHFGYTQTSFWDLKSDSAPFEDTSYKPEFFYMTKNIKSRPTCLQGLFFKTGYKHESNGKSALDSRTINIFYLQPISIFYNKESKYGISISPKFWAYFNTGDHNPDIADYRGYFDIDMRFGKADSYVFSTLFGWAKEGGSVRVDLSYPVSRTWLESFNIYLHMQYVSALAESLLHYQERTNAFRIGFSFVR